MVTTNKFKWELVLNGKKVVSEFEFSEEDLLKPMDEFYKRVEDEIRLKISEVYNK